MTDPDQGLLERVARGIGRPAADAPAGVTMSILAQAASSFGAKPIGDDLTIPTGFDPMAAALFEAVVEAAFLVANADGVFDAEERAVFESVVLHACSDLVDVAQIEALVADLAELLAEDGVEKRARMVARAVTRQDNQLEVLRIAALMAHVSGGVDATERAVLDLLAKGFELEPEAVDNALEQASAALAAA